MSDLAWLEKVIRERTPGPWLLDCNNLEDREIFYSSTVKDVYGQKVAIGKTFQIVGDGKFIAAVGTHADLIWDVIKAANDCFFIRDDKDYFVSEEKLCVLRDAVHALQAAKPEGT